MKYWMTTHFPPRTDGVPIPLGIWLEPHTISAADGMQAGDLMFVYQSRHGDTVLEKHPDGTVKEIRRETGKSGVVNLAVITTPPIVQDGCGEETYKDGRTRNWMYRASATSENSAGYVPCREVALAIGFSEDYTFNGMGKKKSGLLELSELQFTNLKNKFISSVAETDKAIRESVASARRFGPGGEGPEHLALKMAIAADPSKVLGEEGLTTWAVEYWLETSDKIDLVLQDKFGRFVVVEVEVDCDEREVVGPLQCMKYRAMMSYLHNRKMNEVRAILVAHTVHGCVSGKCRSNDISAIEIDRKLIRTM